MDNNKKEFLELIKKLAYQYSTWQVFNDFLCMSAISISNTCSALEKEKRETEYLTIMKRYSKGEQEIFPEMFAYLVMGMETEEDFLGQIYEELNLSQHQKGQYFTPYYISKFMAEIQCADLNFSDLIEKRGYTSVHDPACGSGVMLIALANCFKNLGIPFQNQVLFMAQDIDKTAALMCYIQLSLLGCPAIVIIGDSLTKPGFHPDNEVWVSPFYHLNAWRFRKADEISKEEKNVIIKSSNYYLEETGGQFILPLEEVS